MGQQQKKNTCALRNSNDHKFLQVSILQADFQNPIEIDEDWKIISRNISYV